MKWTILLVIVALVVIVFLLKETGQISSEDALAYLRQGAVVIDVRSPDEFNAEHLPTAINLPLEVLESAVPQRVPDKNRVLLLHCQSGMRSAAAMRKLKGLGYASTYNLGSLARARKIVGSAGGN
ncbi:MAG: rhodanese-like domain-containing protein [Verrucomicrobia bacterium]|nr:rhodanese-like domain-containing protein [Verrucomicrobiota bacterium]